jgi:hypothetical protein
MSKNKYGKPPIKYLVAVKYQTFCDKKFTDKHSYTVENVRYTWIVMDIRNGKVLCESTDSRFTESVKYYVHFPIEWKIYSDCVEWIKSGTIGDIQEGTQNLHIGFENKFLKLV